MNNEFRDQIHNELNLRETEDLLEIWYANNREEWSDTAFEVIKEILVKRLGEIPPQEETADELEVAEDEEEIREDDGLEEWEARILDDENQPELYNTLEVLTLKDNIDKTAKALIIVYSLQGLIYFETFHSIVGSYFLYRTYAAFLINIITVILATLTTALSIAIVYFPLKVLTQILRILMEMEFRSRKAS